jgi:hypothetical protein
MSSQINHPGSAQSKPGLTFRTPKRISITIPNETYRQLVARSSQEGRSLSNLAAYLIESSIGSSE